jgi:hypothetical protein
MGFDESLRPTNWLGMIYNPSSCVAKDELEPEAAQSRISRN